MHANMIICQDATDVEFPIPPPEPQHQNLFHHTPTMQSQATEEHNKSQPNYYRPYPFELLRLTSIMGALLGFQIFTMASSPADAKMLGSFGCHAMLLTQPGCASSTSTRSPLDRQIYILESVTARQLYMLHKIKKVNLPSLPLTTKFSSAPPKAERIMNCFCWCPSNFCTRSALSISMSSIMSGFILTSMCRESWLIATLVSLDS